MELWLTDKCFLLLIVLSALLLFKSLKKQPVRERFSYLFHQPLAICASIVLSFFLIIAILDSIHYHPAQKIALKPGQSISLLDKLVMPLGFQDEKTYSSPLALTLYSAEAQLINGKAEQVYPRLKYIPQSIKSSKDRNQLIKQLLIQSLAISLLVTLIFLVLVISTWCLLSKKAHSLCTKNFLVVVITLFICFLVVITCYLISRYFHLFGTGKTGQDIFYYTIKSIRTGLIIGTLTTLFMLPLALILGIAAGYFGGVIDDIIQYIYTLLSSIPGVLLITASVLALQTYIANHPTQFSTLDESADVRLFALCLILGVTSWTSLCRLLRAETLKLREIDFIIAAKALGSSSYKIIYHHLLPNVMPIVIITVVLDFSYLILAEAVLSYVGVGVSPMTISWGNMINGARLELARDPIVWWPIMAAFTLMFVVVLASNLLADAIRDAFDPQCQK